MSRALSVKVPTAKVIKALETKLAEMNSNYENQEANEAKFQKALEKWRKEVAKFAVDNFAKAENLRTNYRHWNNTLNIDFDIITKGTDFPVEPTRDYEQIHQHTYRETVEDIKNALNILKMTDEETVNATTMKTIARYL